MGRRPVIADVLAPDLTTVFCGSAVGAAAAKSGVPYSGPGNKFWPTLKVVGLVPPDFDPRGYLELPALGLGLTDLNKRESGADHQLSEEADDPQGLRRKILRCAPRILAFTAKRPAKVFFAAQGWDGDLDYGLQPQRLGRTQVFVLTSPSGRAGAFWDLAPWRALAELHRRETQP